MNANICVKSNECTSIGPQSLDNVNEKGLEVINILRSRNLKAPLTFFNHRDKITWRSFNELKIPFQLDQWIINNLTFITDAKVVDYGIPSDHSAIRVFLKLTIKQKKIAISKNSIDWDLLIKDEVKNDFNLKLKDKLIEYRYKNEYEIDFTDFNKLVLDTAKEVAPDKKHKSSGWYNSSINIIQPLMEKRTKVLDFIRQNNIPTEEAKNMCIEAKRNLKDAISVAKANWTNKLAEQIHEMSHSPK